MTIKVFPLPKQHRCKRSDSEPDRPQSAGARERTSLRLIAIMVVALLTRSGNASGAASGEDPGAPMLAFGGFGTLGVVHSDNDQADFTATEFKPNGAGYTHSWSVDVDSLIAGQVTANITTGLSAVLQVISEQNYDNTYTPHVEWANIKYQFTPDFSVRIGRTALPIFMLTDSREIGYTTPWVRPPVEVYRLVPVTSNDGVDASYRMAFGGSSNTLQVTAGQSDPKLPQFGAISAATARARDLVTFVDTFEKGPATLHFNYGRGRITLPEYGPLFDAFRQFGPPGVAIANRYDVANRVATFLGVGASYDPGSWFMMGEWGDIDTDSALGDSAGWYVSGGYRLGKVTPYVTYAKVKADSSAFDPGLNTAGLPASLAGLATSLNAGLNQILGSIAVQRTISIGGRYDFVKNADLKLQYGHTNLGAGSPGILINVQPGFTPGGTVNLFTATIDFVF
jgi:hypothetical protein